MGKEILQKLTCFHRHSARAREAGITFAFADTTNRFVGFLAYPGSATNSPAPK
jgi:hypothetical protein